MIFMLSTIGIWQAKRMNDEKIIYVHKETGEARWEVPYEDKLRYGEPVLP